jgi:hypothetical protein
MVEKTKAGCTLTRSFLMNTNDENINYFYKLLDNGYQEVYYTAPYHWEVVNPKLKKFVTYTEGDISRVQCPSKKTMIKELESTIDWFQKDYSSKTHYCGEGVELLRKLKGRKK